MYLVSDCNLNGASISMSQLQDLTSDEIAGIVGIQCPGSHAESADAYKWSFKMVPVIDLRFLNEDGEEPDGGWKEAYLRHKRSDEENVRNGSPEYAGRQEWLKEWSKDTRLYPLYIVQEDDGYRILDGYHRLAGAFFEGIEYVACFVGVHDVLK